MTLRENQMKGEPEMLTKQIIHLLLEAVAAKPQSIDTAKILVDKFMPDPLKDDLAGPSGPVVAGISSPRSRRWTQEQRAKFKTTLAKKRKKNR
jgi:hypothetical protein